MPSRAARTRLPSLLIASPRDLETHRARRALDHAHRRLDRLAVQVHDLLLGDLADLRLAHRTDGAATRSLRAAVDLGRLLEKIGHRRRAHLEGERAVLINRDDDRYRRVLLQVLRLRIERLAELHDVEAALPQRRPDRRRRVRGAGRDLQLEIAGDLLCHQVLQPEYRRQRGRKAEVILSSVVCLYSFSTCPNSSSTGVARPKIETATFTRERPSSTSSTVPLNEANGPSDTRTCSPTSNVIEGFGRSMPSCTWLMMRCASPSEIGIGFLSAPRKPVTFG